MWSISLVCSVIIVHTVLFLLVEEKLTYKMLCIVYIDYLSIECRHGELYKYATDTKTSNVTT